MRKIVLISLVFMLLSTILYAQKKYVLIVGVSDYLNNIPDLHYCDDDAYRFYAYMKSTKGGSVPDENIAILVDEAATRTNILRTMDKIFSKAGKDDMLLFYFSGHGGDGFFVPTKPVKTLNHCYFTPMLRRYLKGTTLKIKLY